MRAQTSVVITCFASSDTTSTAFIGTDDVINSITGDDVTAGCDVISTATATVSGGVVSVDDVLSFVVFDVDVVSCND